MGTPSSAIAEMASHHGSTIYIPILLILFLFLFLVIAHFSGGKITIRLGKSGKYGEITTHRPRRRRRRKAL